MKPDITPQLLVSTQASLPCLCCLLNPVGIWCRICLGRLTIASRSNISESNLAQLSASKWLQNVAGCIDQEAFGKCQSTKAVKTCLTKNIADAAPGRKWSLKWNSENLNLIISNDGNSEDTALLLVVAEDLDTLETFEIAMPVDSAVVTVPQCQSVSLNIPVLKVFKHKRTLLEFTVFSADAVGLNGDGVASLLVDKSEEKGI